MLFFIKEDDCILKNLSIFCTLLCVSQKRQMLQRRGETFGILASPIHKRLKFLDVSFQLSLCVSVLMVLFGLCVEGCIRWFTVD